MKNKILLILGLCVLALFADDLAMRVARLEYEGRDNVYRRARLTAVEKETAKIRNIEQQVHQLQQKILALNPLLAKSNLTAQRLTILQGILDRTALAQGGFRVFRTTKKVNFVQTASIGSLPEYQNVNWGGHFFSRVGSVAPDNVGRTLIKFNEFKPGIFEGKKVLSAVLYIKQKQNDSIIEDDAALNETIDLYAVRKKWNQGLNLRGAAEKGDVTWVSARAHEENWTVPGCSSQRDDYDPTVLASTGPSVSGDSTEWVAVIFNDAGIERLKDKSWENNGFLLKMRDESKANTAIFFDSARAFPENIPYLEIYYQDEKLRSEHR